MALLQVSWYNLPKYNCYGQLFSNIYVSSPSLQPVFRDKMSLSSMKLRVIFMEGEGGLKMNLNLASLACRVDGNLSPHAESRNLCSSRSSR